MKAMLRVAIVIDLRLKERMYIPDTDNSDERVNSAVLQEKDQNVDKTIGFRSKLLRNC